MKILKSIFEFYLHSSIHVSIAVWSLYKISFIYLNSPYIQYLDCLVITSTIVGYNKIKFGSIFLKNKKLVSNEIKVISVLAFLIGFWCFIKVNLLIKIIFLLSFIVVFIYTIPNPYSKKNMRNTNGIKIFLVAFSWTLVTYFSLFNEMKNENFLQYFILGLQRFIFVLVATIPFEIRDINLDENELMTIPQKFGIFKSKLIGVFLLGINSLFFLGVENINIYYITLELFVYAILAYALVKVTKYKKLNYTRFWVEGIPIFWVFNLFILSQLF
ncbi:MAG: hypothetical protein CMC21_03575 [Flavobacteriaceae bacterium]|nr:hypothetical protein [Flavobacteriaceae bacterium]|tara:strand:- start:1700 stop:2515 length:816 start_codon:yes stop_codon:yes gene_type:complete